MRQRESKLFALFVLHFTISFCGFHFCETFLWNSSYKLFLWNFILKLWRSPFLTDILYGYEYGRVSGGTYLLHITHWVWWYTPTNITPSHLLCLCVALLFMCRWSIGDWIVLFPTLFHGPIFSVYIQCHRFLFIYIAHCWFPHSPIYSLLLPTFQSISISNSFKFHSNFIGIHFHSIHVSVGAFYTNHNGTCSVGDKIFDVPTQVVIPPGVCPLVPYTGAPTISPPHCNIIYVFYSVLCSYAFDFGIELGMGTICVLFQSICWVAKPWKSLNFDKVSKFLYEICCTVRLLHFMLFEKGLWFSLFVLGSV